MRKSRVVTFPAETSCWCGNGQTGRSSGGPNTGLTGSCGGGASSSLPVPVSEEELSYSCARNQKKT